MADTQTVDQRPTWQLREAARRLQVYGPNELPTAAGRRLARRGVVTKDPPRMDLGPYRIWPVSWSDFPSEKGKCNEHIRTI